MESYKLSEIFKFFDPEYSKRYFLKGTSKSYTYGDLITSINILSRKLKLAGVKKVLLIAKNKAGFITAIFACLISGVKPIVCSPEMACEQESHFPPEYFDAILTDCDNSKTNSYKVEKITITDSDGSADSGEEKLEDLADTLIPAKTIFAYLFTSGSTGANKLVEKTLENIVVEVKHLAELTDTSEKDFFLSVVPYYHMYGFLFSLILPCYIGASTNLDTPYSPGSILSYLEREQPAIFVGIPAHYISLSRIAQNNKINTKTKLAISSTGHLPEEVQKQIQSLLGWNILEIYGSTETGGIASREFPNKEWTAFEYVSLKLSQDTLEVKSPAVSESYTGKYGFFKTFDLVSPCADNRRFSLVGRERQLLKIAGNRVFTPDVEEVIKSHSDVTEAVVLGIEVDGMREIKVIAFVKLKDKNVFSGSKFNAYLKKKLTLYQMPKKIFYMDAIPKTINGKVVYAELEKIAKSKKSIPSQ